MSANKMEQSLDDILKASKTSRRGRSTRRPGTGRPAAAPAPVGGVAKTTKQGKQAKPAPATPAAVLGGETKIMVSNLPRDIDQVQLQVFEPTLLAFANPYECDPTTRAFSLRLPHANISSYRNDESG
ncbi:RNA-binding RNA annealing protein [Exserohilum turcicum]